MLSFNNLVKENYFFPLSWKKYYKKGSVILLLYSFTVTTEFKNKPKSTEQMVEYKY